MVLLTFRETTCTSPLYLQTLALRERVLRIPIDLVLSAEDVAGEDQQRHFVMLDGDDLVACVVIKPLHVTSVKLRQMAVSSLYQGRNVGRDLIVAVEEVLVGSGITDIEMSARQSAIGFYEKLGYHVTGEPYIEQGIPHVRMEKALR